MEFRQIRYFIAVAEHLHFRRASEAVHIAQPSLSQQIHHLETELGAVLFERNNRKVQLTPAGRLFYEKAKALLRDADRAREETRRVACGHAGLLTVSFITSAALNVLPAIIKIFQSAYPTVELKLVESPPAEQFAGLYDRTVDVALVIANVDDPVLDTLVLDRPNLVAAVPKGHRLAKAESFDISELSSEVLIIPENHPFPGLYAKIRFALQMAGVEPKKELNIRLIQTGLLLVGSGLGVSLVPDTFARIHSPGVVFLPLKPELPPVQICAVWRRENTSPILDEFIRVAKDIYPAGGRAPIGKSKSHHAKAPEDPSPAHPSADKQGKN